MFLEVTDVKKAYNDDPESLTQVLRGVSMEVEEGEICILLGSSGSGKSTLLNCIGGLDGFDSGSIKVGGLELAGLSPKNLLQYRRDCLGFVFQAYHLIPNLTVEENILTCRHLAKNPMDLEELLSVLEIGELRNRFPSALSGGQKQRCAIARALIKNPKLLLCDEPTGALDSTMAREILLLLEKINHLYGTTILMVTHNRAICPMADHVITLHDGQVLENTKNPRRTPVVELGEL